VLHLEGSGLHAHLDLEFAPEPGGHSPRAPANTASAKLEFVLMHELSRLIHNGEFRGR